MDSDWIKQTVADRLNGSKIVQTMADELCTLLGDRPEEIAPGDYFHVVATVLLEQLRGRMLEHCRTGMLHEQQPDSEQFDYARILQGLLLALERDLLESNMQMIGALGGAIAERDTGTSEHNYRVVIYAVELARILGRPREDIRALIKGAFLHDIGKIGIPDAVLVKPSGLSADERSLMNSHVRRGAHVIQGVTWLSDALDVVRYHHEWWNGEGYLDGLRGEAIPLNARIFTIGDVFDAMTSRRPYKVPYSFDDALESVREAAGTQFDPEIVVAFEQISEEVYSEVQADRGARLEDIIRGLMHEYFGFTYGSELMPHPIA